MNLEIIRAARAEVAAEGGRIQSLLANLDEIIGLEMGKTTAPNPRRDSFMRAATKAPSQNGRKAWPETANGWQKGLKQAILDSMPSKPFTVEEVTARLR